MATNTNTVTDLEIKLANPNKSDKELIATWNWDKKNTAGYKVKWQYYTGDTKEYGNEVLVVKDESSKMTFTDLDGSNKTTITVGSNKTTEYRPTKKVWITGSTDDSCTSKNALYTAPDNALQVRLFVTPIAKKVKKKDATGKEVEVAAWTAEQRKAFFNVSKVAKPNAGDYTINISSETQSSRVILTLSCDISSEDDDLTKTIDFQVIENDATIYKTVNNLNVTLGHVTTTVEAHGNSSYKIRARGKTKYNVYSDWTNFSSSVKTPPVAATTTTSGIQIITPSTDIEDTSSSSDGIIADAARYSDVRITKLTAYDSTSVLVEFAESKVVDDYTIEYTDNKLLYNTNQASSVTAVKSPALITSLETGKKWYFRIRGNNEAGSSEWATINEIMLGTTPKSPTTWSSSLTGNIDQGITLYWIANSEDNFTPKESELFINIISSDAGKLGVKSKVIANDKEDGTINDILSYDLGTAIKELFPQIQSTEVSLSWYVRTKGSLDDWSENSTERTINSYALPSLSVGVSGTNDTIVEGAMIFPLSFDCSVYPLTQSVIGCSIEIFATTDYDTADENGTLNHIINGSRIFNRVSNVSRNYFSIVLQAGDIILENNTTYDYKIIAYMNSGMTATYEGSFTWVVAETDINLTHSIIEPMDDNYTVKILPICRNDYLVDIPFVDLSVYRRNVDGTLTTIAEGLPSATNVVVTDMHPALDYSRYRIVGRHRQSGMVAVYDMPYYPNNIPYIVITWDDTSGIFVGTELSDADATVWSGNVLVLPFNIDITDNYTPDNALVKYVGRKKPVKYDGTQVSHTTTINTDIPKDDIETLELIRKLASWQGDVYIREPTGTGYYASINVSYNIKHLALVIPVTLSITEVEGDDSQ